MLLEINVNSLGLSVKQVMLEDKVELDVISQETISNEDFEVCKKNVQFPVKWNAFSDRNGMLFSGLTEWLSDTNGMAR